MTYKEHREEVYEVAQRFVRLGQKPDYSSGYQAAMHSVFIELIRACLRAAKTGNVEIEEIKGESTHVPH